MTRSPRGDDALSELSGRRFDLFALAELVRAQGWAVPPRVAIQRAERNAA